MPTLLDMTYAAEPAWVDDLFLLLPLLALLMILATARLIAVGEAQRENVGRVALDRRRPRAPRTDAEAEDDALDPR